MDEHDLHVKLDRILTLLEQLVGQTAPRQRAKRKPDPLCPTRNAPVNEWLDWRDKERKKGRRVTLVKIAEWSKWSISTLKHASMDRRKPRTNHA